MSSKDLNSLTTWTRDIGTRLRELRDERGWSQARLAADLAMSQPRLSAIERGTASLTAEQFVRAMRLFRVGVSDFVSDPSTGLDAELRVALVALGARHLVAPEVVLPEALRDVDRVVVDVLLSREPRLIQALAPVLVHNADHLNLARVFTALDRVGAAARLGWLLDNVVVAIDRVVSADPAPSLRTRRALARARTVFESFLERIDVERPETGTGATPDLLDPTLRSIRSVRSTRATASAISNEWKIVTSIQPDDFAEALNDGLASRR